MDGTDLIEADETDLLSEAAVARLRAHPRFREAAEAFATNALAAYHSEDVATRWLTRDLGRASIYLAAMILDGTEDGATVAGLTAAAAASGACSRGRVIAFVHYAQATGRLLVPAGPGPWGRRRLTLAPAFLAPSRLRMTGGFQAAAIVAPEVAEALPQLCSDASTRQATATVGLLLALRPELNRNPGGPLRQIFMARDCGTRLLQHFLINQAPDRGRLMESARISRADLARRYAVSRTHVNRLLADAEAAGLLRFAAADHIVFSPEFSCEVETFIAGVIQVNRVVAHALMNRTAA